MVQEGSRGLGVPPPGGTPETPLTEMCFGTEASSYLRLIDSCTTQLKAQGPSRTCNESKEEEEVLTHALSRSVPARSGLVFEAHRLLYHSA